MSLLTYGKPTRVFTKLDARQEAAIYDYLTGEASVREATKVVGCSANAVYVVAVNQVKQWMSEDSLDLSSVKERILQRLAHEESKVAEIDRPTTKRKYVRSGKYAKKTS